MPVIDPKCHLTTSIRLTFTTTAEQDTLIHSRLMRPQQAAMRVAYNMLNSDGNRQSVWERLRKMFPLLTGRNLNDAILLAEATIASQIESDNAYLALLERRAQTKDPARLKKLQAKRARFDAERAGHRVRPAIFGGHKLWRQLQRCVPGARDAWRDARTNEFFSTGDRTAPSGNHHARLVWSDAEPELALRVPVEKAGRSTRANWLHVPVCVTRQQQPILRALTARGRKYTVRLLRQAPGRYLGYITVDEPVKGLVLAGREPARGVVAGIDLNLDHLCVAVTRDGQALDIRDFAYPNLGELRATKAAPLVGSLARQVVTWAAEQGATTLALEDLRIQDADGGRRYNRRTHPFAYRRLVTALTRAARRAGLDVRYVNPAYTSWIGQLKYGPMAQLSRHQAAAWVIARRAAGYDERLPKAVIAALPMVVVAVEQATWLRPKVRAVWLERLNNWKDHSPLKGRPWLLWVTLYLADKNTSGARGALTRGRNPTPFNSVARATPDPGRGGVTGAARTTSHAHQPPRVTAGMPPVRPGDKAPGPTTLTLVF